MSLQIITPVKIFTSLLLVSCFAFADWKVDMSRRTDSMVKKKDIMSDSPDLSNGSSNVFDSIFKTETQASEIVVLNTANGFVPDKLHLNKGKKYKVHLVNINEKQKNISFVLGAFSEHHSTYFGKVKTFYMTPKAEGVFSFECPETSASGKVVVFDKMPEASVEMRMPASQ